MFTPSCCQPAVLPLTYPCTFILPVQLPRKQRQRELGTDCRPPEQRLLDGERCTARQRGGTLRLGPEAGPQQLCHILAQPTDEVTCFAEKDDGVGELRGKGML